MLRNDCRAGDTDHTAKRQCDESRVVELTEHRNEVRDQIDRRRQVRDEQQQRPLRATRYALVADQALEQDGAIRQKARDVARSAQAASALRSTSNCAI